jgi:diguanylate cyclase (GGDEF)-like protein
VIMHGLRRGRAHHGGRLHRLGKRGHRHHGRRHHKGARTVRVNARMARSAGAGSIGVTGSIGQAATAAVSPAPRSVPSARSATLVSLSGPAATRGLTYAGAPGNVARPRVIRPAVARLGNPAPATARITVNHASRLHQAAAPAATPPPILFIPPSAIPQFVRVVPQEIWIALAAAVVLAGGAAAVALRTSRRARRQAGEFAAVAAVAHTDSLTDALNRRGFTQAVERELARARRYQSQFVLAYFDVRGLKRLNDSQGHQAGDKLLTEVAGLLKDSARAADVVGRIGGDEFALLLTEQSADFADVVTSRIRRRVADRRTALKLGVPWDLTIGTAAYPEDGQTFDELLATADRRLYEQRGIELGSPRRGRLKPEDAAASRGRRRPREAKA